MDNKKPETVSRREFLRNTVAAGTVAVLTPSNYADEVKKERKLLLLSNSSLKGEYLTYAKDWIAEHFNTNASRKRILFVPYAAAAKDWDKYAKKVADALAPLGIDIISAHKVNPVARLNATGKDKIDGIFVGGGNTFLLLDTLQKTGLLSEIKRKVEAGLPYMGSSAGSNVAAPTIKTTNDMPIVWPESPDAMHLVPFQINAHYVDGKFYYEEGAKKVPYNGESRADRLNEFHEQNNLPVVGLREGSVLRVRDDKVELLGGKPATLFQKDKKPLEITDGKALSILNQRQKDGVRQAK